MISVNDFRTGLTIEVDGDIYSVVEFQHVKPGKGAAFVRSKLKNLRNGNLVPLPGVIGASVSRAQNRLSNAGFDSFVAGTVASSSPAGTIAYTNPSGSAFPGSRIALYVSSGQPAVVAPQPPTQGDPPGFPDPTKTKPPKGRR